MGERAKDKKKEKKNLIGISQPSTVSFCPSLFRAICDILMSLCLCDCRYYGLSVWFPDVIKHLQADEYASKVKLYNNERIEGFTFNFTLENQIHINCLFINDQ